MNAPTTPAVTVTDLCKMFRRADGSVVPAVEHTSFEVAQGEFVVLLGPSGCGKTTLLRCIAGLETPDTGELRLNDRVVFSDEQRINRPPERRSLSMIFQSYALWPHMTVFKNVAYPLERERPRIRRSEVAERVSEALERVGVGALAKQYPNQLSGGQQQRVALARALVRRSNLILFDEPLSNVDAKIREQLRAELLQLQHEIGFAAIYVTHDQIEAMQLADRVAVLENGRVLQFDSPRDVYYKPATRYVASFVGAINELKGTVKRIEGQLATVQTEAGSLECSGANDEAINEGDAVLVVWRPELTDFRTGTCDVPAQNALEGIVETSAFSGDHVEEVAVVAGQRIRRKALDRDRRGVGDAVWVVLEAEHLRLVPVAS